MTTTVRRLALWKVALLAFVAMLADDCAYTIMVVAEARYSAVTAALFDEIGWIAGLICSALALESIIKDGWRTRRSMVLILAISAANVIGTLLGVHLAAALTHHH